MVLVEIELEGQTIVLNEWYAEGSAMKLGWELSIISDAQLVTSLRVTELAVIWHYIKSCDEGLFNKMINSIDPHN